MKKKFYKKLKIGAVMTFALISMFILNGFTKIDIDRVNAVDSVDHLELYEMELAERNYRERGYRIVHSTTRGLLDVRVSRTISIDEDFCESTARQIRI